MEPTRAKKNLLTDKKHVNGRPVDNVSAKVIVRFLHSFILYIRKQ